MAKTEQRLNAAHKVFETEWFSIDAVPISSADGRPYYRLSCNDSVEVLAVTENKEIVVVRQYRPPLGTFVIELPSGYVDDEELPEEAIVRELEEETGYICDSVTYLGPFKIAPSRINNTLHLFFGKGAKLSEKKVAEDGNIEVLLVNQNDFRGLVKAGEFQEIAGLAAYWLAETEGLL